MATEPIRAGIIGCGHVSQAYLEAIRSHTALQVIACADLEKSRAEERAAQYDIPRVGSVEEVINDPEIEVIVNLTVPEAHGPVGLAAVKAGKALFSEKPLAFEREEARQILAIAADKGVFVGCAPDLFLGSRLQTCRKLLDDGWIGKPVAATAFLLRYGHHSEQWRMNPATYYQPWSGPLFNAGPYYFSALLSLLGPVHRIAAMTQTVASERIIRGRPDGRDITIAVKTPTHVTGLMEFTSGCVGTTIISFDVQASKTAGIEIHGTEGTLCISDPQRFDSTISLQRQGALEWSTIPPAYSQSVDIQGIGLIEMAYALQVGQAPRADGKLAYHIIDVAHAFFDAAQAEEYVEVKSTCHRPAPLPSGYEIGRPYQRP